jgi:hypothetical protein
MVDINNATVADLKALPGRTDGDTAKIVQSMPAMISKPDGLTSCCGRAP